jgi:flagellar biosynthesis protein FlhB
MSEERSIPASERRLLRARERGMAPVRRAPIALAGVLGGALGAAVAWWQGGLTEGLAATLGAGLGVDAVRDPAEPFIALIGGVLRVAWPAMAGGVAGAVLGAMAQTGGRLSWNRPRGSLGARLAGMSGAGAWGRAGGAVLWTSAAALGAGGVLRLEWAAVAALPRLPLERAVPACARVAVAAVAAAFALLAVLAVLDAAWARLRWQRSLALSPEDAREEARATDGDPNLRATRRRAARRALAALRAKDPSALEHGVSA